MTCDAFLILGHRKEGMELLRAEIWIGDVGRCSVGLGVLGLRIVRGAVAGGVLLRHFWH